MLIAFGEISQGLRSLILISICTLKLGTVTTVIFIFISFESYRILTYFKFGIVELLVVISSSLFVLKCGQGNLNLITQALAAVGCKLQVIPDPTTVHFHLPNNLSVRVHRQYSEFIAELTKNFPHEKEGILKFYSECWKVCFD